MVRRFKNSMKYRVERMVLRGAHYRLVFIAMLIGLVSLGGGLLAEYGGAGFDETHEAVWWAFLRLTDPGYLGDDEGIFRRILSTALTVLGYVLFMGALIAIMTQWLQQTLTNLQSGLTPIAVRGHVLILGWTNRTPTLVRELVLSEERVKRFLVLHGRGSLRIVILAEEVTTERVQELRDELGEAWDPHQVILRTGSALRIDHLYRVAFADAAAIIIPGADYAYSGADSSDTRIIKTLMSITHHGRDGEAGTLPVLATEIFDVRKVPVARQAYDGPIEVTASDSFVSRLVAQTVRHRGLSLVYGELLSQGEGNEIYIRTHAAFEGARFHDLRGLFLDATLLGVVRPVSNGFQPFLNPPEDFVLAKGDKLALMAHSYSDCEPTRGKKPVPTQVGPPSDGLAGIKPRRRVLILGWSHKVPSLLNEFESYGAETFDVTVMTAYPVQDRATVTAEYGYNLTRVTVNHLESGYTVPLNLRKVDPASFDSVVFVASDWVGSGEEADARTILGYLLLREVLGDGDGGPDVLLELMDPDNAELFDTAQCEFLTSPLILSHILSQVALRRELRSVYDELFGPGGAEVFFRPASDYCEVGSGIAFSVLRERAMERGEIALGVRTHRGSNNPIGRVQLNPHPTDRFDIEDGDEVVVLSTYTMREGTQPSPEDADPAGGETA